MLCVYVEVVQLCDSLLLCLWNSPGRNTRVGSHSLLQGIFLTQGLNPCVLHCRQILYHLSCQETPLNVLCWPKWEWNPKGGEIHIYLYVHTHTHIYTYTYIYIYIHMAGELYYTAETKTTLWNNYTPMNVKFNHCGCICYITFEQLNCKSFQFIVRYRG